MSEANLTGGGGGGVPIGSIAWFPYTEDVDVTVKGQRYLRSGLIETNPAKFDADIWAGTVGTMLTALGTITTSSSSRVVSDIQSNGSTLLCLFSQVASTEPEYAISYNNGATWSASAFALSMSGLTMLSVDYGAAKWVVVGRGGKIATSTDGTSWTARSSTTTADLFQVSWNGSMFVAVGVGVILTSPDGIAWTSRTVPAGLAGQQFNFVAFGNNTWVAVGAGSVCATAPADGTVWTQRTLGLGTNALMALLFDATSAKFYLGGGDRMASSSDGISWTVLTSVNGPNFTGISSDYGVKMTLLGGYFHWAAHTNWSRSKDFNGVQPLYSPQATSQMRACKTLRNGKAILMTSVSNSHVLYQLNDAPYAGHPYNMTLPQTVGHQALTAFVRIS